MLLYIYYTSYLTRAEQGFYSPVASCLVHVVCMWSRAASASSAAAAAISSDEPTGGGTNQRTKPGQMTASSI